jgi:hypothetical protein
VALLVLVLVLTGTVAAEELPDPSPDRVEACGGIWTAEPAIRPASSGRPLAAASCATDRPSAAAIELSDSPVVTVCAKNAEAEAGATNIAAAASGINIRALMSGDCGPDRLA